MLKKNCYFVNKTIEKTLRFERVIKFRGTKTGLIFNVFSCAMLEDALKRTKTLPKRSWDAPKTLQDAPGRVRGGTWGLLGPSWAPRRPQDATKTHRKKDQKSSKTEFYAQEPPQSPSRHQPADGVPLLGSVWGPQN